MNVVSSVVVDLEKARDPATPDEELQAIVARNHLPDIRRAVASHPNASVATLEKVVGLYPQSVEANPALPFLELTEPWLPPSGERGAVGLFHVLQPLTLTTQNLDRMKAWATHPDDSMRRGVASNPNLTLELAEALAKDSVLSVRSTVARNEQVPPVVLDRLASDPHPLVREAVAENYSTPRDTLERLEQDRDGAVSRKAKEMLHFFARQAEKERELRERPRWVRR